MKVLKRFRDKKTNKRYKPGDEWKCDDKKRVEDAVERGLIEKPKEKPKAKKDSKEEPKKKSEK